MAKPIVELLTELQTAVAKMDTDKVAMEKASVEAQKKLDAAKSVYEKETDAAKKSVSAATAKFNDTAGYVTTLQGELNKILGTATNPRVTVG